jgi:hypothetical protein
MGDGPGTQLIGYIRVRVSGYIRVRVSGCGRSGTFSRRRERWRIVVLSDEQPEPERSSVSTSDGLPGPKAPKTRGLLPSPSMVIPLTAATSRRIWPRSELFASIVSFPSLRLTVAGRATALEEGGGAAGFFFA